MSNPEKPQEKKSDWAKVGPCLYRYREATYYALVKHGGKQIRQSLETTDAALAKRKLAKFKSDLDKIEPGAARHTIAHHRTIHEKTLDLPSKKRGGAFLLIGFMALGGFVVQRGFIAEGRV